MKIEDVLTRSFKRLRHELGHDRPRDTRPMWLIRLSTDTAFCKAVVANGYLTEAQMQHAASRYRLGRSCDGGVIFWQINYLEQIYDGKIMFYREDCHRDHHRHPQWVSNQMKRYYLKDDKELIASIPSYHCLCCCLLFHVLLSTAHKHSIFFFPLLFVLQTLNVSTEKESYERNRQ